MNNSNESWVGTIIGKFNMSVNLPKEYLEEIGIITVRFVFLERALMDTISQLSGADSQLINRLISTDSFEVLLSKFKKLLIFKFHENGLEDKCLLTELNSLIKSLGKANDKRNSIIHSYLFQDKDGSVARHKFKRKIKEHYSIDEFETVTLKSLKELSTAIMLSTLALSDFKEKIIGLSLINKKFKLIPDIIKDSLLNIGKEQNETKKKKET